MEERAEYQAVASPSALGAATEGDLTHRIVDSHHRMRDAEWAREAAEREHREALDEYGRREEARRPGREEAVLARALPSLRAMSEEAVLAAVAAARRRQSAATEGLRAAERELNLAERELSQCMDEALRRKMDERSEPV